jgi:hypothetical protein
VIQEKETEILIAKNDYERTKAAVADKQTTLDAYR